MVIESLGGVKMHIPRKIYGKSDRVCIVCLVGKEPTCQCGRHKRRGFDPCMGKIPWRRAWQPTPVFLPWKSNGHMSLVCYSLWGCKELNTTEVTKHTCLVCNPDMHNFQLLKKSYFTASLRFFTLHQGYYFASEKIGNKRDLLMHMSRQNDVEIVVAVSRI